MLALVAALALALPAPSEAPAADPAAAYEAIARLRRAGKKREAAESFERLAAEFPASRLAPRALASAAAIWHWDLEDLGRARALYDQVLAGPDDLPGVQPALVGRLAIERDEKGPRGELALVEQLYQARPRGAYAPWLLLRAALILDVDLGQTAAALAPLKRIRESFPRSTRAAAAAMREAAMLRKLHRAREAIVVYQTITAKEETSLIVGEYNSSRLDDAYFEIAETYRLDLGDPERAESAYLALVDHVPESRWVDDALFRAAELDRQAGDEARARRITGRLAELRPGSRYLGPRARERSR